MIEGHKKFILAGKLLSLLAVFLLLSFLIGREFRSAQLRTLNYFMPASYGALLSPIVPNPQILQQYITYFKIVSGMGGRSADAYALLGFCYARLGRADTALSFFEKAAALNPSSFWIYYDVAVLYLKRNLYPQAAQMFSRALRIEPTQAFRSMYSSKIYVDMLAGQEVSAQTVGQQLEQGYAKAKQLLVFSRQVLDHKIPPDVAANVTKDLDVQIY